MCILQHVRTGRPVVFTLFRRIPKTRLRRSNETAAEIVGLSGAATAHELFIADSANNVVRAFNLKEDRFVAPKVYTGSAASGEFVHDVAYNSEWRTLYVATLDLKSAKVRVRAFARTATGWRDFHRLNFASDGNGRVLLRVLRDGSVFIGQLDSAKVLMCRVQTDRSIKHCTKRTLPEVHRGFDVLLADNELRLAVALQSGSVHLYRVYAERRALILRSNATLPGARSPLFCGETLLVGKASNKTNATSNEFTGSVSFTFRDDRLQFHGQLDEAGDQSAISIWWFVKGSLYVIFSDNTDLSVYSMLWIK